MKPTVDTIEAAELMAVHSNTVEDLIRDCVLPAAKIGRKWILNTRDVLNHIDNEIAKQTAARMRKPAKPKAERIAAPA